MATTVTIDAGQTVVESGDGSTLVNVVDGLRGPQGPPGEKGEPGSGSVDSVNRLGPDASGNVQVTVHVTRAVFDLIQDPDPNIMYFIDDE